MSSWWQNAAPPGQAGSPASLAFAGAVLLPYIPEVPVLSSHLRHAGLRLRQRAVLPGRLLRAGGHRPQHRRRPGRPARPRLRRLLRHRRLHDGRPRLGPRQPAVAGHGPDRHRRGHDGRLPARACRRCGYGATTSPSSRSGSARSSASPPTTPTGWVVPAASRTSPSRRRGSGCSSGCSTPSRTTGWCSLAIVLVILVYKALEHSRVGRAWLAIREDEDAAELMGVPTFKFKLWAFAMGAAIGGFSGHALRQLRRLHHTRTRSTSRCRSCSSPPSCSVGRAT